MLNILVIHIRFAEYDRCSGDLRLTNILRILSKENKVALHILYKPPEFIASPDQRKYLDLMRSLDIEVKRGSLRSRVSERRYDIVLIEFWYVARHLFSQIRAMQPDAKIVVDTEHVYFRVDQLRALATGGGADTLEAQRDKRRELDTYAKADLVITTTDEDMGVLLEENPRLVIATIPNIHDVVPLDRIMDADRKSNSLVYVGNFASNPANIDGIVDFCTRTLPLIRQRIPDAMLTIVGNAPPAAVRDLACDYVRVTGYVPDVAPYLAASMVSICPLRFGAGLKGKIGEAMMHGLPVVTTSIGTQGMNCRPGVDIMVGDTPEQFAQCVIQLLEQASLWKTVSRNGRDLVVRNYSFDAVSARIDQVLSGLGKVAVKRYGEPRRLALKARFHIADLLNRHLLWKFIRSG